MFVANETLLWNPAPKTGGGLKKQRWVQINLLTTKKFLVGIVAHF